MAHSRLGPSFTLLLHLHLTLPGTGSRGWHREAPPALTPYFKAVIMQLFSPLLNPGLTGGDLIFSPNLQVVKPEAERVQTLAGVSWLSSEGRSQSTALAPYFWNTPRCPVWAAGQDANPAPPKKPCYFPSLGQGHPLELHTSRERVVETPSWAGFQNAWSSRTGAGEAAGPHKGPIVVTAESQGQTLLAPLQSPFQA